MLSDRIVSIVVKAFMPRRPLHYVTKPLCTVMVFIAAFFMVEALVIGDGTPHLFNRLQVAAIVKAPFVLAVFALVIHMDQTQNKLEDEATTDVLTDLPNRRAFEQDANIALERNEDGFLLIIDADHFKSINDTYGHGVGDICLQQIADRIATVCDKDAFYGRIGGEEFAVFLHNRTLSDIKGIGNRLCSTLLVHVEGMPHPLRLTVSVGATEIKPSDTLPDALERADNALYYAKENGRAQLQLWRKDLKERAA